jgi:hypothetical protein
MTNYQYNYAIIERTSKMCMEVRTSSHDQSDSSNDEWIFVTIESYNEEYLFKYYNEADGKFYWDDAFTQEFIP